MEGGGVLTSVVVSVVMLVGLTNLNGQERASRGPRPDPCCVSPVLCMWHVVSRPRQQ